MYSSSMHLVDPAIYQLASGLRSENASVALAAARDILDRAGLRASPVRLTMWLCESAFVRSSSASLTPLERTATGVKRSAQHADLRVYVFDSPRQLSRTHQRESERGAKGRVVAFLMGTRFGGVAVEHVLLPPEGHHTIDRVVMLDESARSRQRIAGIEYK